MDTASANIGYLNTFGYCLRAFCTFVIQVDVATTSDRVQLTSHDGKILSGVNTIHRYVAGLGSKKEQLLGNSPATEALIAEWLSFKNTQLVPITEEQLLKVSCILRVYGSRSNCLH